MVGSRYNRSSFWALTDLTTHSMSCAWTLSVQSFPKVPAGPIDLVYEGGNISRKLNLTKDILLNQNYDDR